MIIKGIEFENFGNYKKPSMFIAFPYCNWKCEKEANCPGICQNGALASSPNLNIPIHKIVHAYKDNNIAQAIVCGGLEPFDSWEDLRKLIVELRLYTNDDIIIYTGYKYEEINYAIDFLLQFPNIIIKFGRFIPNQKSHYDSVLGVELASDNQYAERIS